MAQYSYNTFAGVDIQAVFADTVFGELQMISYKSDRDKAPVYTMGSPDLRCVSRGKRLITGACVFIVFDRDSLLNAMYDSDYAQVALNIEDSAALDDEDTAYLAGTSVYSDLSVTGANSDSTDAGTLASQLKEVTTASIADQLLPFDITLVGANEYGATTKMSIRGVEIMSEGSGVSIDDMSIEKQFSFLARRITTWTNGTAIADSAVSKLNSLLG